MIRLNGRDPDEERALARLKYNHAFISPELLTEFEQVLKTQIATQKDAGTAFTYLTGYSLQFFINKLKLADPIEWKKKEDAFARVLLNKADDPIPDHLRLLEPEVMLSKKTILQIVHVTNRFLKFLHKQFPDEVRPVELEPFLPNSSALRSHEALRELKGMIRESKYIPPDHWEILVKKMIERDIKWRHTAIAAIAFGLRRGEALGLQKSSLRRTHLKIEDQIDRWTPTGVRLFRPLKDREKRSIPYWGMGPKELSELIEEIGKFQIHPDTFTFEFTEFTKEIFPDSGGYVPHDMRGTWITNMLKKHHAEDVRLAAGHANIETTYKHYGAPQKAA